MISITSGLINVQYIYIYETVRTTTLQTASTLIGMTLPSYFLFKPHVDDFL